MADEKTVIFSQEVKTLPTGLHAKLENYMSENDVTKIGAIRELLRYAFKKKEEEGEAY